MIIIINGFKILKIINDRLIKYKKSIQEGVVDGKKTKFYAILEDKYQNIVFFFSVKTGIDYDKAQFSINNINTMDIKIEKIFIEVIIPLALIFKPYDLGYKFLVIPTTDTLEKDKESLTSESTSHVPVTDFDNNAILDKLSYKSSTTNIEETQDVVGHKESIGSKRTSDTEDCINGLGNVNGESSNTTLDNISNQNSNNNKEVTKMVPTFNKFDNCNSNSVINKGNKKVGTIFVTSLLLLLF